MYNMFGEPNDAADQKRYLLIKVQNEDPSG